MIIQEGEGLRVFLNLAADPAKSQRVIHSGEDNLIMKPSLCNTDIVGETNRYHLLARRSVASRNFYYLKTGFRVEKFQ